eukprot:CAMPEP_0119367206 /NCGR_PEP_ID=MMETSP1334-20130426/14021_1 /TAXON_ID=127549 /ORGANISM="Calcidiscus leptoporus, Strain RCC1130" /LENGTH=64 /DNA_ID=CAMNT_0007383579 /DNA_START=115 /DNA_END=309 /DNA_ORIENTATION=+
MACPRDAAGVVSGSSENESECAALTSVCEVECSALAASSACVVQTSNRTEIRHVYCTEKHAEKS